MTDEPLVELTVVVPGRIPESSPTPITYSTGFSPSYTYAAQMTIYSHPQLVAHADFRPDQVSQCQCHSSDFYDGVPLVPLLVCGVVSAAVLWLIFGLIGWVISL